MELLENAQLALDTINRRPTRGIPTWMIHPMEHSHIERLAGVQPGEYKNHPEDVYIAMQQNVGTCMLDQYIPENPLTMGYVGYEGAVPGATTGAKEIMLDGMIIDSPEAVVQHMERFVFPWLKHTAENFDEDARVKDIIEAERSIQTRLGSNILKCPYGYASFPGMAYFTYGYVNYFCAYALYPDVMEKHFSLQADIALLNNHALARAIREGNLPPFCRLDHDMADSRGTLVRIDSLDRIWFPSFAKSIEPLRHANVCMIWHCDGNLMEMVPRLLDCGIQGFQGFQYEDGMDYERICRMKTRDGGSLLIIAGVSVTRTLPIGTPDDVKRELTWLVEHGPRTGLFLAASSSITPGVPWENLITLVEGLRYYREHGRV